MKTSELRERLIKCIDSAEEGLLKKVEAIVDNYQESEVVACTIVGEPLSREQYRQELLNAEKEVLNGEVISQEDLEKESEGW